MLSVLAASLGNVERKFQSGLNSMCKRLSRGMSGGMFGSVWEAWSTSNEHITRPYSLQLLTFFGSRINLLLAARTLRHQCWHWCKSTSLASTFPLCCRWKTAKKITWLSWFQWPTPRDDAIGLQSHSEQILLRMPSNSCDQCSMALGLVECK